MNDKDDPLPFSSLVPKIAKQMKDYPQKPKLRLNFEILNVDEFKELVEDYCSEVMRAINTRLRASANKH